MELLPGPLPELLLLLLETLPLPLPELPLPEALSEPLAPPGLPPPELSADTFATDVTRLFALVFWDETFRALVVWDEAFRAETAAGVHPVHVDLMGLQELKIIDAT